MGIGPVPACQRTDAEAAEPGGRSLPAAPLNPLPRETGVARGRGPWAVYASRSNRQSPPMDQYRDVLAGILLAVENAGRTARRPLPARLLAVSKTRTPAEVAALADALRPANGERLRTAYGEN